MQGTLYGCRCGAGRIKYGDINIGDARPGERVQLETSEGGRKREPGKKKRRKKQAAERGISPSRDPRCDGVIGRELTARRAIVRRSASRRRKLVEGNIVLLRTTRREGKGREPSAERRFCARSARTALSEEAAVLLSRFFARMHTRFMLLALLSPLCSPSRPSVRSSSPARPPRAFTALFPLAARSTWMLRTSRDTAPSPACHGKPYRSMPLSLSLSLSLSFSLSLSLSLSLSVSLLYRVFHAGISCALALSGSPLRDRRAQRGTAFDVDESLGSVSRVSGFRENYTDSEIRANCINTDECRPRRVAAESE